MKVFKLRKALRYQLLRLVTPRHVPLLVTAKSTPNSWERDQVRHTIRELVWQWTGNETQQPRERLPESHFYNKPRETILSCHEVSVAFREEYASWRGTLFLPHARSASAVCFNPTTVIIRLLFSLTFSWPLSGTASPQDSHPQHHRRCGGLTGSGAPLKGRVARLRLPPPPHK